jgi:hypothetical protein
VESARVDIPGVYAPFENPFAVDVAGTFEGDFGVCFPTDYADGIAGQEIFFSLRDVDGNLSNEVRADPLPPLACADSEILVRLRPDDLGAGRTIPDDNAAGVASTVSLSGSGLTAKKVVVFVHDVRHSFDEDLTFLLQAGGVGRTLAAGLGGAGDNFIGTVFDDGCTTSIGNGTAPFTGCFRPQQALTSFVGRSIDVNWSLRVIDGAAGDVGVLNDWMLGLCL